MKSYHILAYGYHRLIRSFHKRPGKWQTAAFELHYRAMKYHKSFLLLILISLVWVTPNTKAEFMNDEQRSIVAAQKLIAATVKIEPDATSTGSGFFVDNEHILTNWHVIKSAGHTVRYRNAKGQSCSGEVVSVDEHIDLALLKTRCTNDTFLQTQETSYLGQTVLVAGNPGIFDFSVSKGIVSAYRWDYIQTDAKIKTGSSGGIVANLSGEVIGVTVKIATDEEGISFAIPAKEVNRFLERAR